MRKISILILHLFFLVTFIEFYLVYENMMGWVYPPRELEFILVMVLQISFIVLLGFFECKIDENLTKG